jgi:hypothetical protein
MKLFFRLLSITFCLSALFLTSGCETDSPETDEIVSDTNFYTGLGAAMVNCYHDIYNQNLAGQPTGNQNKTANGPLGGTVVITGTTTKDNTNNITTANLTMNMAGVKYNYAYGSSGNQVVADITLTGSTSYSGSFNTTYTSLNYQSSNLHVVGTVTYKGKVRSIDQTGPVVINNSSNITVTIFGNTVSW